MQAACFEEVLELIVARELRYHRDAYRFVREALDHTQKAIAKSRKSEPKHVTGKELLEGIRQYALSQFGPMTLAVFEEWGVRSGEDFGEIVFRMVEFGLLAKTEEDRLDDFRGGYDFEEAFRKPFLPESRGSRPEQPAKPAS